MTICIAAIAGKDHVVIASDRMVTLAVPSTEFEQGLPKTIRVTNNCVAATAGSALAYTPIHRDAQIEIQKNNTHEIMQIAEETRVHYVKNRNKKIEQDILSKIGLTLERFLSLNRQLSPELSAQLYGAMNVYNYSRSGFEWCPHL